MKARNEEALVTKASNEDSDSERTGSPRQKNIHAVAVLLEDFKDRRR